VFPVSSNRCELPKGSVNNDGLREISPEIYSFGIRINLAAAWLGAERRADGVVLSDGP
jgi:hypothetical protein